MKNLEKKSTLTKKRTVTVLLLLIAIIAVCWVVVGIRISVKGPNAAKAEPAVVTGCKWTATGKEEGYGYPYDCSGTCERACNMYLADKNTTVCDCLVLAQPVDTGGGGAVKGGE